MNPGGLFFKTLAQPRGRIKCESQSQTGSYTGAGRAQAQLNRVVSFMGMLRVEVCVHPRGHWTGSLWKRTAISGAFF